MKNGYDNVGSCPEALEFRSNSYKYGDYLGRFRAEVAKPGMAAVSKTAGPCPREFESLPRRHSILTIIHLHRNYEGTHDRKRTDHGDSTGIPVVSVSDSDLLTEFGFLGLTLTGCRIQLLQQFALLVGDALRNGYHDAYHEVSTGG